AQRIVYRRGDVVGDVHQVCQVVCVLVVQVVGPVHYPVVQDAAENCFVGDLTPGFGHGGGQLNQDVGGELHSVPHHLHVFFGGVPVFRHPACPFLRDCCHYGGCAAFCQDGGLCSVR